MKRLILMMLFICLMLSISDGIITYLTLKQGIAIELNFLPKFLQQSLELELWLIIHILSYIIIAFVLSKTLNLERNWKLSVSGVFMWFVVEFSLSVYTICNL